MARLLPPSLRARLRHGHYMLTGNRPPMHWIIEERNAFFRRTMKMLAFNQISGDYAEFGSHGGLTFGMAYTNARLFGTPRHQWAFDSFRGLPAPIDTLDEHPAWVEGKMCTSPADFRRQCRRIGIADDEMTIVEGFYEDTIGPGAAGYRGPLPTDIAFAYLDCDLRSSTTTVLGFLKSRLKHGMVIGFDDYFCYSPTNVAGERAAMLEFLSGEDRFELLPYLPCCWAGMSFIVEDKAQLDRYRSGFLLR